MCLPIKRDFTHSQVWGLLLTASLLVLLLEIAADKLYNKPQTADKIYHEPRGDFGINYLPTRK